MAKRTKYVVVDKKGKIVSSATTKRTANLTPLEPGDKLYSLIKSYKSVKRKK